MAVPPVATTEPSTLAVGVTVVATLVIVGLIVAALSVVRSARRLRAAAEELAASSAALLADVDRTVTRAGVELERVGDLVGSAESITETVGSASRLAYASVANPLIKAMALGRGTARASRRFRYARAQSDRQRRLGASEGRSGAAGPTPEATRSARRRLPARR